MRDYRENATIVMRYQITRTLSKFSQWQCNAVYGTAGTSIRQAGCILRLRGESCHGDFAYSHFNYDLNALYDREKDVKTGIEQFVVTAYLITKSN
ncbi:hypothetical protein P7H17_00015 [Paenibacillus larvae]|nr:hypothetical protein [Paenibacillus larvae]MDT2284829.1 hypothetical protein [Paenibacillus larvae]